ncbi:hypothetical protein TNCV_2652061 [Trichonephila clavipes]|nr:hypothetical protein TNCV_2652061 [Trichonephila clavipes]
MSPNTVKAVHHCKPSKKISQRLPGLESLREKKSVVSYDYLLTINGTKCSSLQEGARAAGLSKSKDFIKEVLIDAASAMNLIEEERQERILRKKEQISGTT